MKGMEFFVGIRTCGKFLASERKWLYNMLNYLFAGGAHGQRI